jgi:hypothetical protein
MSQENVEIVRRAFAYEVYGVGDRAVAEAIFDPEVVMNPTEEAPTYAWTRFGTTSSVGRTHGRNSK